MSSISVKMISISFWNLRFPDRDGYKRKEFSYSSFCRSFYIPENVNKEKIEANYKDGILTVGLPKQEEEKNKITRQVKIS